MLQDCQTAFLDPSNIDIIIGVFSFYSLTLLMLLTLISPLKINWPRKTFNIILRLTKNYRSIQLIFTLQ
jgi:hypothetical protein